MRLALALSLLAVVACGEAPPKPVVVPVTPPPTPFVTAPASRAPLFLEVVGVSTDWVLRVMPVTPADLEGWVDAPKQSLRHVLIKGKGDPRARKRAQALLDRAKKGEDFATLAESSEDPGSKDKGGEYPDEAVKDIALPVKTAYDKLKVGEVSPALIESDLGFHVVKKSKPSEELLTPAYKMATAPALAQKLAREVLARLSTSRDARAAIADAVVAVLGDTASADERRPKPIVVERERIAPSRLPASVKDALTRFADHAKPGEVLTDPIESPIDHTVFVARAATQPN